ncbi:MAG: hypothetical protein FJ038_06055 [Chloroflexi bacterium]|nr:hypothetical protein [Chloroflexota bacterium]
MAKPVQTWELWYPEAGASGLEFAHGRIDPTRVLWVHAAPPVLAVTIREGDDRVTARGEPLRHVGAQLPLTRLELVGESVVREDRWPTDSDLGSLVILPGGEVGTLLGWWNAPDGSEWRWQVEFYNHR